MKWNTTAIFIAISLLSLQAQAKHIRPRIEPVEINGVRFTAPNDQGFRGYVEAWGASSGEKLWETTIYHVFFRLPLPELDHYYCVIVKMKTKDGKVLVENDHDKWYSLDPTTRKTRRITAKEAED